MLELEAALQHILAALPPPQPQTLPLSEAAGRFLTTPLSAATDLPPFDNSAMDGYAVRAADVAQAQATQPVTLKLLGKAAAGSTFEGAVSAGGCVRLFTGSPLPCGADAVVMQEDTRTTATQPDAVQVLARVEAGENVRWHGEDVRRGTRLIEAGTRLTAGRLCLLAATGQAEVSVGRSPIVGLLATGSELRPPGQALTPGQIYESNRVGLAALVRQAGALPKLFPLLPDDLTATQQALTHALEQCDILVTSGGVSVGEMDFIKPAFQAAGGELQFWKVAIKPGRPFVFGRRANKLLFGLPGNPVSALVTFLLLVRPALLRWQGASETVLPTCPGVLAEELTNPGPRRHFLRVCVDSSGKVASAGTQASHVLSALAAANGLLDLPAGAHWPAATPVQVLRWEE